MSRKLFNLPVQSSGLILSTAYKDWGKSTFRSTSANNWHNIHGTARWVTLKIMKDNPYFDIDWNLNIDHTSTWNSEACRVVMSYSTNNKSSWSTPKDTKNYLVNQCWNNTRNIPGNSRASNVLYNPGGLNLVAGNYIAFGIQIHPDSSSSLCRINQNSENQSGNSEHDVQWRGGGSFIRVREINFSSSDIVLDGLVCNGVQDA